MITENLTPLWRIVFKQVWFAYCADSMPIGCAIFDDDELLVAVGRNSIYDNRGKGLVQLHQLGHAEINALLKVSKHQYPNLANFIMLSSLEPCPMCIGAFAMSRIKTLYFAATDLVAGSKELISKSKYISEKELTVLGPDKRFQFLQIAILAEFVQHKRPSEVNFLFAQWRQTDTLAVDLGIRWFRDGYLIELKKMYVAKQISYDEIFDELISIKAV